MRLALALIALAALAPNAVAATVDVREQLPGEPFSDIAKRVVVEDTAGESNSMTVSYGYLSEGSGIGPAVVTVRDSSVAPVPGEGCEQADAEAVRCTVDNLGRIDVFLGAGGLDTATATPEGEESCGCVWLWGGDGIDYIGLRDGGHADGQADNDAVGAGASPAKRMRGALEPDQNILDGGTGNDTLVGGSGDDVLEGGPGDDTVRGKSGNDVVAGGYAAPDFTVEGPAGRDVVDGGEDDDQVTDGDVLQKVDRLELPDEIGPDRVSGSSGEDVLRSYENRTDAVLVDLSSEGGDGQMSERDNVVNVETVYGGRAADVIVGDGDANTFFPGRGDNYITGRGGRDYVVVVGGTRNLVRTNRGDDRIRTSAWARGPYDCGPGRDRVEQRRRYVARQPDRTRNLGPVLNRNCEAIALSFDARAWALRPWASLRGRTLEFPSVPRTLNRKGFALTVTEPEKPFERIGRARVRRDGATVRVSRSLARRFARRGGLLRAEVTEGGRLRMIWRFALARTR